MTAQVRINWLLSVLTSCVAAQDVQVDATRQAADRQMPPTAIWRFGLAGDETDGNGIFRLNFSPNGRYLAARNRDNRVLIYDLSTRQQLCEVQPHEAWVIQIDFSPDSRFFLTTAVGVDEKVRVWNTQTGKLECELAENATAAFFADDKVIKVLENEIVATYEYPVGTALTKQRWADEGDQPLSMSRDGRWVISYRAIPPADNRIFQTQVTDLENLKSKIILPGPTAIPKSVVISPNNNWVAAAYHRFDKVQLWDLRDPHQQKFSLVQHQQPVQSVAFSPDNRFLVSTGWDKRVVVWDVLSKKSIACLEGHTEHVNAADLSPVNFLIASGASGSTDCSTIIWDLKPNLFPGPATALTEAEFDSAWKQLGSDSPRTALGAVDSLVHSADLLMPRITLEIGIQNQSASQMEIADWIDQLNSPSFATRQDATQKLLQARGPAELMLQKSLAEAESAEIIYRITRILRQPIPRPKIDEQELRRLYRAVLVLELIGDSNAIALLENIAYTHTHIDVARDATAALGRLKMIHDM